MPKQLSAAVWFCENASRQVINLLCGDRVNHIALPWLVRWQYWYTSKMLLWLAQEQLLWT
jgi:hypothetical protein